MYIPRHLVDTLSNWRLQQRKQIENLTGLKLHIKLHFSSLDV